MLGLSQIRPLLLYEFKSDADLVDAVQEISQKFTLNRESIGDYLKDPRLVAAYTTFYLLTNLPKLTEVLKWMPKEWVETLKQSAFVDLGAGPGTFSLAWKEFSGAGEFYQIEQSLHMREQGKKLWDGIVGTELHQGKDWSWTTSREKFIVFGHSANEMGAQEAISFIKKINPEHILFIEPGTKSFFQEMLKIREFLLSNDFNVLYPCPEDLPCPMANGNDWCHQFIYVKHDPEVERLTQMARKDRSLLPLTVQAYSKTFKVQNPSERLVRVYSETKFSLEWDVCHNNELNHYQVMKKDFSKAEAKELGEILAGEAIETEVIKTFEKTKRVKLLKVKKNLLSDT
jgi:ribosomal protein RSM22 (predicted rRNA methylase)